MFERRTDWQLRKTRLRNCIGASESVPPRALLLLDGVLELGDLLLLVLHGALELLVGLAGSSVRVK